MDEELIFRSKLGTWRKNGSWYSVGLSNAPPDDSRQYRVSSCGGSYRIVNSYNSDKAGVIELIAKLEAQGFAQDTLMYPELQEFFRNGRPVTVGLIVEEALDEVTFEPLDSPLDAMLKSL